MSYTTTFISKAGACLLVALILGTPAQAQYQSENRNHPHLVAQIPQVEKLNPPSRRPYYFRLLALAMAAHGDESRALKLAAKIPAPNGSTTLQDEIYRLSARYHAQLGHNQMEQLPSKNGHCGQALRAAQKIKATGPRTDALLAVAEVLLWNSRHDEVGPILSSIPPLPKNEATLEGRCQIAMFWTAVDEARGERLFNALKQEALAAKNKQRAEEAQRKAKWKQSPEGKLEGELPAGDSYGDPKDVREIGIVAAYLAKSGWHEEAIELARGDSRALSYLGGVLISEGPVELAQRAYTSQTDVSQKVFDLGRLAILLVRRGQKAEALSTIALAQKQWESQGVAIPVNAYVLPLAAAAAGGVAEGEKLWDSLKSAPAFQSNQDGFWINLVLTSVNIPEDEVFSLLSKPDQLLALQRGEQLLEQKYKGTTSEAKYLTGLASHYQRSGNTKRGLTLLQSARTSVEAKTKQRKEFWANDAFEDPKHADLIEIAEHYRQWGYLTTSHNILEFVRSKMGVTNGQLASDIAQNEYLELAAEILKRPGSDRLAADECLSLLDTWMTVLRQQRPFLELPAVPAWVSRIKAPLVQLECRARWDIATLFLPANQLNIFVSGHGTNVTVQKFPESSDILSSLLGED